MNALNFGRTEPAGTEITLFGPFSCRAPEPVSFEAKSAQQLLALVALSGSRGVSKARICAELWPDSPEDRAKANLRQSRLRVRKALPNFDAILEETESLRLNREFVVTDKDRADWHRRKYNFAPHLPESLNELRLEWDIVSKPLLSGWRDEWVEQERALAEIRAHELGMTLAKAYESQGQYEESLKILRHLAGSEIVDFELASYILKLETKLNGTQQALITYQDIEHKLQENAPVAFTQLLKRIRENQFDFIPAPNLFQTKNELVLLARMVEQNLNVPNSGAMQMLAQESGNLTNWSHPSVLLSILTVALDKTGVKTDAEIQVAVNCVFLGSYASDPQIGLWAGNQVLGALPETDERAITAMSVMGFLNFEIKNYDEAHRLLTRAYDLSQNHPIIRPRVLNRLAVLNYHSGHFDAAKSMFLDAIAMEEASAQPNSNQLIASYSGNICTMEVLRQQWAESIKYGERTVQLARQHGPIYETYVKAGMGLSEFMLGNRQGLKRLTDGIKTTYSERMHRFNLIANDFGAVALAQLKEPTYAQVAQANKQVRDAMGFPRSPAEQQFVNAMLKETGEQVTLSSGSVSLWIAEKLTEATG